jgi:hypothetical protein
MKKILFFLLLLFPTNAFAINFKMSCSGNWSPTEFFDEKYVITDTNISKYEGTYYQSESKNRRTYKKNESFRIVRKDRDIIYAVPTFSSDIGFISLNLEKSEIFYYKTEYSEPDLKNRIKETTKITRKATCIRIN